MNTTVDYPQKMTVQPEHTIGDRVMVYVDEENQRHALLLWINPQTAAQWIEALTPIAEQARP